MKKLLLIIVKKITILLGGTNIGKIKPLFNIYKKVLSVLKPNQVYIEGSRMILDKEDSLLLSIYPNFETDTTKLVKNKLKNGMRAVDIGAHIGYFTLLMARLVGPKGKVYAFEPNKSNFNLLKQNIKLNSYENVIAVNAAIAGTNRSSKLFLSNDNPQDHRIVKTKNEKRKYQRVKTYTLDSYFKDCKIDFIKMDTQGAEPLIFKGAKKVLDRNRKLKIVFEFWPYMISKFEKDPFKFLTELNRLGRLSVVGKNGKLMKFAKYKFPNNISADENAVYEIFLD